MPMIHALLFKSTLKLTNLVKKLPLFSLIAFMSACSGRENTALQLQKFVYEAPKMGTQFKLVFYAEDSAQAKAAEVAAFALIDSLNLIMSDYVSDSELMRLAATAGEGRWVQVSKPLWEVLQASQAANHMSHGAFDVASGNLTRLWRRAVKTGQLPTAERLATAKAQSGSEFMLMDAQEQAVQLTRAGLRLDLGGIAKGYTADAVLALLAAMGIEQALIDAGGDITVGAAPPGEQAWKVLVPPLDSLSEPLTLRLSHSAVATSGDLYQFLEKDGKRYSHLINPKTGEALTESRQVTVVTSNGTQADWLASAFSVMDSAAAWHLADSLGNVAVQILTLDESRKQKIRNKGFL